MNTVAGAVVLIAVLLLPMCIAACACVLKRLTGNRGFAGLVTAAVAILIAAAITLLFIIAHPVNGLVRQKSEQIQVAQTGLPPNILHVLRVIVIPADVDKDSGSLTKELTLAVDAESFDRLSEGETVSLRESRFGPLKIAQLADVPWWRVLPLPEVQRFWPWDLLPGRTPVPMRPAAAQVIAVRTVREVLLTSWIRARTTVVFPLPQAYDEVTLRLQSPNGSAVIAVDRIDTGSVSGLTVGHTIPVLVPDVQLRKAQLAAGTRRYLMQAWRAGNYCLLPQIAAGLVVALLLVFGLVALSRRKARIARVIRRRPES
jgi:hypothetical protein